MLFIFWAGDVARLVECLPDINETLDLIASATQTGHGGACL